ncbi:MAG: cytochrome C oxidase subunit IV family protein [Planctomycetota bacterium]
MSTGHETGHFNANKIFITLFILTAVEVAWSLVFAHQPHWLKWGGLLVFAFWKGILIYSYFMHMKFEGWLVKALIAPTPILIAIVIFALMPDISLNSKLVYPVGSQLDKTGHQPGKVVDMHDAPGTKPGGGH